MGTNGQRDLDGTRRFDGRSLDVRPTTFRALFRGSNVSRSVLQFDDMSGIDEAVAGNAEQFHTKVCSTVRLVLASRYE